MPENEVTGTEGRRKGNGTVNEPIGDGGWEISEGEPNDGTCSEEEVPRERPDHTWFLEVYPRTK